MGYLHIARRHLIEFHFGSTSLEHEMSDLRSRVKKKSWIPKYQRHRILVTDTSTIDLEALNTLAPN